MLNQTKNLLRCAVFCLSMGAIFSTHAQSTCEKKTPSDLTRATDACLSTVLEQFTHRVEQRYKYLVAQLPALAMSESENEYDGLTKRHIEALHLSWQTYAKDYCTAQAKSYGLTKRYENRSYTICQIRSSERHLKDLKAF